MATFLRAIVMLLVLVGLPAAWVCCEPLPPPAVGILKRTVLAAQQAIGWEKTQTDADFQQAPKTAPRFDARIDAQAVVAEQQVPALATRATFTHDPQIALASASLPISVDKSAASLEIDRDLANQLEPHLSLLRRLGAEQYTLESWGGSGALYRFRCGIALGENADHTRQFEAVDADPRQAVHQVVGEVTAWQNARRLGGGASRWH